MPLVYSLVASRTLASPVEIVMSRRARTLAPALVLAALATIVPPAVATPPEPPVELRLVLLETPAPGRPTPFAIEVTPRVPAGRMRVRVVAPRDVALAAPGDTLLLAGETGIGQSRRWTGTARVPPGRRRFVYVRVEMDTPSGRTWSRGASLEFLAGPLLVPDPVAHARADGRGGTLVEYDGAAGTTR
jgi:hypothetical protein